MAGGKETPRQKMIGMMYLVLTALLALNISKEVLNGFVKVERGLIQTQETLKSKSLNTFGEISNRYDNNKEKVGPFFDAALEVKTASEELRAYMQTLKATTMAASEGKLKLRTSGELESEPETLEPYLGVDSKGAPMCIPLDFKRPEDQDKPLADQKNLISKPDAYDAVTLLLYGTDIANPRDGAWSAVELRKKLEAYRDGLKAITFVDAEGLSVDLPDGLKNSIDKRFEFKNEFENKEERTWEYVNFNHVPLAAVMPIMSKIIIDVQDAEQDVLSFLNSRIDGESFKVNDFRPLLVPQSNYVLQGDTIRAKVMLAGFDKTNEPKMYVSTTPHNGDTIPLDYEELTPLSVDSADGFGDFRLASNDVGQGEHRFQTMVVYYDQYGQPKEYPLISDPITVAPPSVVISPTKMNVFYRGVENPVDISIPGVSQDKITASISRPHKLKKSRGGSWVVEPGEGQAAKITVTAEFPDGSKKPMPAQEFRVKRIPDPVPTLAAANPTSPAIKKTVLKTYPPVVAKMDNFDFELQPVVKGFELSIVKNGIPVNLPSNSPFFTSEMKTVLNKTRVGDAINIENIRVEMPGGDTRTLATLRLKVIS